MNQNKKLGGKLDSYLLALDKKNMKTGAENFKFSNGARTHASEWMISWCKTVIQYSAVAMILLLASNRE